MEYGIILDLEDEVMTSKTRTFTASNRTYTQIRKDVEVAVASTEEVVVPEDVDDIDSDF